MGTPSKPTRHDSRIQIITNAADVQTELHWLTNLTVFDLKFLAQIGVRI